MTTDRMLWIVAGPPGAGKTALASALFAKWRGTPRLIDADDPATPGAAGIADGRRGPLTALDIAIEDAVTLGESFAVESRLVMREPLSTALRLRRTGWPTTLIYMALPRIDLCRARIDGRVLSGGADILTEDLETGFRAALDNLPRHIDAAARWLILDGTGLRPPRIAEGAHAGAVIHQEDAFRALLPDYPAIPAAASVRADRWPDPVLAIFNEVAARCRTLERLMRVAERMEEITERRD